VAEANVPFTSATQSSLHQLPTRQHRAQDRLENFVTAEAGLPRGKGDEDEQPARLYRTRAQHRNIFGDDVNSPVNGESEDGPRLHRRRRDRALRRKILFANRNRTVTEVEEETYGQRGARGYLERLGIVKSNPLSEDEECPKRHRCIDHPKKVVFKDIGMLEEAEEEQPARQRRPKSHVKKVVFEDMKGEEDEEKEPGRHRRANIHLRSSVFREEPTMQRRPKVQGRRVARTEAAPIGGEDENLVGQNRKKDDHLGSAAATDLNSSVGEEEELEERSPERHSSERVRLADGVDAESSDEESVESEAKKPFPPKETLRSGSIRIRGLSPSEETLIILS